jgi:hypothetical protein
MTAISIEVKTAKAMKAIQQLLKAGSIPNTTPIKTWEDLTADDYRMMMKMRRPVFKAKSLEGYER